MYSIKLHHGQGMTFPDCKLYKTVSAELRWQDDDGTSTLAATTSSCIWTPKTAARADKWAWARGMELKADYGAYLRKHGERKEVVQANKAKADKAERERLHQINRRLLEKRDAILAAVKVGDPALASYLETGA